MSSRLSKEEILGKYHSHIDMLLPDCPEELFGDTTVLYSHEAALKAMSEYAQQEAIGFAQWVTLNDWTYLKSKGYWVNEEMEESNKTFTGEELYNLYLK